MSSGRKDQFAVEGEPANGRDLVAASSCSVYETSLFLAILFDSPRQTTTILSHLIPDLYSNITTPLFHLTTLLSLVHHLAAAYPSQNTFRQHLRSLPHSLLCPDSQSHVWIASLASCLRSLNYSKFEELTRPSSFLSLLRVTHEPNRKDSSATVPTSISAPLDTSSLNLAKRAFYALVDSLRTKAREKTWHVIRSAYRELACHSESGTSRDWLERSLSLQPIVSACKGVDVDEWLENKSQEGQVRKKDGASEGRWIVCKVR